MYIINIKPKLDKIFLKLSRKSPKTLKIIHNKIQEVIQNPMHYKNLRKPIHQLKRVHMRKSFVLTFSVNEETKTVTFEDYDHHDNIYLK
jgi:YafQ family addiction module toxin component